MVLSDAAPAQGPERLAGLIASGFRMDKGPKSGPLPGSRTKPPQQKVEHGRVQYLHERDARVWRLDPADLALDRLDARKAEPDVLVHHRAVGELDLAAEGRHVEHRHVIGDLARTPQR